MARQQAGVAHRRISQTTEINHVRVRKLEHTRELMAMPVFDYVAQ